MQQEDERPFAGLDVVQRHVVPDLGVALAEPGACVDRCGGECGCGVHFNPLSRDLVDATDPDPDAVASRPGDTRVCTRVGTSVRIWQMSSRGSRSPVSCKG